MEFRDSGANLLRHRDQEVFPGCPTFESDCMIVNENPGFVMNVDEVLAAKYPIPEDP
tara:strand:- start:378 stop:548 length:171 start_codon:yes stop_codon:yes gene_type:complete